jgi:hypothetical protein
MESLINELDYLNQTTLTWPRKSLESFKIIYTPTPGLYSY